MPSKVWDEITWPFPDLHCVAVEVKEWIGNLIPQIVMGVIMYPFVCMFYSTCVVLLHKRIAIMHKGYLL